MRAIRLTRDFEAETSFKESARLEPVWVSAEKIEWWCVRGARTIIRIGGFFLWVTETPAEVLALIAEV